MEEKEELTIVNSRKVIKLIWQKRKLFYYTLPIAIVVASLYIICIPRTYTVGIKLAPEYDLASTGSLNSIAAQFGLDFASNPTTDAISPTLYPDLIKSTPFVVSMFSVHVKNIDGTIDTDYYTYLLKHQKCAWWEYVFYWIKNQFTGAGPTNANTVDPFRLTKKQTEIAKAISKLIRCDVDKKTDVISFTITDQDPLICACIADSVSQKLQDFITEYRTSKARNDVKYYQKLTSEAKHDYEKARQLYGSYSDEHADVILESYQSKIDDLENDMQLKYNMYTSMNNQLQAAKAKVQEKTPAFTVLQGATVPIRPTGPKRMLFVLGAFILTFIGTGIYLLRDIIR